MTDITVVGLGHPPAPLRVFPPLLREGRRTLWPGKAGSAGALENAITVHGLRLLDSRMES